MKTKPKRKTVGKEADSVYFLKILMYFVLGTIWIKWNGYLVLPVGLILGILFAQKDHFAIDRKIEYVVLLLSALLALLGFGVYLAF